MIRTGCNFILSLLLLGSLIHCGSGYVVSSPGDSQNDDQEQSDDSTDEENTNPEGNQDDQQDQTGQQGQADQQGSDPVTPDDGTTPDGGGEPATPPTSVSDDTYQVYQGQILANGEPIVLFGVNWFGFETNNYVVHGLWARNYSEMISQMEGLGFNAVRLPFCPDSLDGVTPSSIDESRNEDLVGLNSLQILDVIVNKLNSEEMYILFDHHSPDCSAISELWYTDDYSEEEWMEDLVFLANRYKNLPYFIGLDLKNEPHGEASWGTGDNTDWKLAAEKAALAILEVNSNILIFVEGIQENDSCQATDWGHWWGGNLEPQACLPLDIDSTKLVLSPHVYGPDVYVQDYFDDPNFPDNMPEIWNTHFGFLVDGEQVVAPGEFGGKYGEGDIRDVDWQNTLIDYFIDKNICTFFYWSWNPNSGDTGGILDDDWETVEEGKYENLVRLMEECD